MLFLFHTIFVFGCFGVTATRPHRNRLYLLYFRYRLWLVHFFTLKFARKLCRNDGPFTFPDNPTLPFTLPMGDGFFIPVFLIPFIPKGNLLLPLFQNYYYPYIPSALSPILATGDPLGAFHFCATGDGCQTFQDQHTTKLSRPNMPGNGRNELTVAF